VRIYSPRLCQAFLLESEFRRIARRIFLISSHADKNDTLNFQSLPFQTERAFSRKRNGRRGTSPVNMGTNERSRSDLGKLDIRVDFKAPCSPNTAQLQSLLNLAAGLLCVYSAFFGLQSSPESHFSALLPFFECQNDAFVLQAACNQLYNRISHNYLTSKLGFYPGH